MPEGGAARGLADRVRNGPDAPERVRAVSDCPATAEGEGLEPPRACARRISSAVPYQLGLALPTRSGPLCGPLQNKKM